MAAMTDYLENKLIDQLFRGQAYAFPSTLYFALFTTETTDAGGGTEVSGGAYERKSVACSLANFAGTQAAGSVDVSAGTSGATSNNIVVEFPVPTSSWGNVSYVAFFDAHTGGHMLLHGKLKKPKTVDVGVAPKFAAGAVVCAIDTEE